jgi:hypothetical protein
LEVLAGMTRKVELVHGNQIPWEGNVYQEGHVEQARQVEKDDQDDKAIPLLITRPCPTASHVT